MRKKKEEHPKIAALQERAKAVEETAVRQTVPLDMQTFDKMVQFVEEEGCTLSEGLRRAVRIGVEALMLERAPGPSVPPTVDFPGGARPHSGTFRTNNLEEDEEVPSETEGTDYASTPPPGI
jgi:hypothetical protein